MKATDILKKYVLPNLPYLLSVSYTHLIVKVLYNDEEWNGYYLLSAEEKAAIQRKMEQ